MTEPARSPRSTIAEDARLLRGFAGRLLARESASAPLSAAAAGQVAALRLAEAGLRLSVEALERPPQVAVFGPTQAGKSTVVNLLLGQTSAAVSPLAGFTVHAQGFAVDVEAGDWAQALFPGAERVARAALAREELDTYSLERVTGPAPLPPCVVWDTPDFDSLAAHSYQRGVLEIAALADVLVLVLSREKYSDLTVWRLLDLLAPLHTPLVICLNKMTPDAEPVISAALRQQLRASADVRAEAPLISVPYLTDVHAATAQPAVQELRELVSGAISGTLLAQRRTPARLAPLLRAHWKAWLAPILAEHAAFDEWRRLVDAALEDALADYQRDYLDHPQRYDSFRRATLELLQLLDFPGVGKPIAQIRQVVTWPVRRLLAAGVRLVDARRGRPPRGADAELEILSSIVEEIPARLQREAARRATPASPAFAIWSALAHELAAQHEQLDAGLMQAVQSHARQTQHEIHVSANELYALLKQRPAVLNTLRATRLATDLGSLALAVKTGGMHPHDLLLAPATLALTTLFTEGALGTYMAGVASDLKRRQLASARRAILSGSLSGMFAELLRKSAAAQEYISPAEVTAAEGALERLEARADA